MHESLVGTFETCRRLRRMSAFRGNAEGTRTSPNRRFRLGTDFPRSIDLTGCNASTLTSEENDVSVAQQGWSCIKTITRAVEAGFVHKKIGTGDEFAKGDPQFDCGRVPVWKIDGPKRIFPGWRQLCNAIAAPSTDALKRVLGTAYG
jgi:hypothetical protein